MKDCSPEKGGNAAQHFDLHSRNLNHFWRALLVGAGDVRTGIIVFFSERKRPVAVKGIISNFGWWSNEFMAADLWVRTAPVGFGHGLSISMFLSVVHEFTR